ncbi:Neurogenic locus notch-like protein 1 [Nibea albiflora]|uniref:Neurogenic locus notch-like protein 1 n=1 Tax=Nibea albiflora TaxID=240163 RepID=A0ACB7F5Q9_NIBAL|nr:Neurogenic locus notch-like protein 1 [Nibea albiflora]
MSTLRAFVLLGLSWTCQAAASDPWGQCPASRKCKEKFRDGSCDEVCMAPECLRDGFDCLKDRGQCNPGHIQYCRDHYANSHCEQGCHSAACGWDGSDCFTYQSPVWAKGTLVLHIKTPPHQRSTFSNNSLLWALSVLLQTPLKLRHSVPLSTNRNLFDFDPQQLANLLTQPSPADSNGSLLFLQVDNRPCSRPPSTCFPYATEAASFLLAIKSLRPTSFSSFPELTAIISIRGVREEIGSRVEGTMVTEVKEPTPAWMWAVIAIAIGLPLALALVVFLVVRRVRQRRAEREDCNRVRHRSTVTDNDPKSKALALHGVHQEQRTRSSREKDKISLRKKKKAKEAEKKRRREPLGEDAIRMRPLKRDQDIGSDTDFTQSSMEDISARCSRRPEDTSICDHRTQEQKHYRGAPSQPRRPIQPPPRGWERNAMPPPLLSPPQQSAEWCGPDGSVVLIRAVRSGLDRVVLELLRAGVPVNNTDHTGRSALHWACSVNHLSLTRTLIRYGAAVDLQDNKIQRGPVPVDPNNDMLWEERSLMYSPWVGSQGMPGRSASFSGIIAHRDITPPPQNDWSINRVPNQYPSPQNWRPQLNQSATALVPPRIMGRSPRPISTLQEVTSEDEDRDRHQEAPRAATPHFLSPQPAPRQRSFSCTQHALQRRSSGHQPEPNYVIVTDRTANEPIERVVVSPPTDVVVQSDRQPPVIGDNPSRAEQAVMSSTNPEQKSKASTGSPTELQLPPDSCWNTIMKLIQDSEDAKAQRKSLKPQVERRRRERMNRSLESLKTLLLQQQEATQRRLEKAEILEHTVLFLQNTATGDKTRSESGGGCQKQSFQDGFSTCLKRASQFLGPEGKGLWLGAALDASFAARFSRSDSDSAGVQRRSDAHSSSNSLLFRNSSRSILRSLMHRSGHKLCTPALSAKRGVSHRSSTTPQQPHKAASRASKQSPSQSQQLSQSLWRPWP